MLDKLTDEQRITHQSAIAKGYMDDYSVRWRTTTFAGVWLWNHPSRIRVYETFLDILGRPPEWKDITDLNLISFMDIRSDEVCASSLRTECAELKGIIGKYYDAMNIPSKRYKDILSTKKDASDAIYLSRKELKLIHNYEPKTPLEERVKALFLIEAITGARTSDCKKMTLLNVNFETETVRYTSKKTHTSVMIPLHSWATDYLPKDIEDLNSCPDVNKMSMNRIIRRICEAVGINKVVTIYRRGKEETAPKWKFASSHTARRSFATNLYVYGTTLELISSFMGHASIEMTLNYIKEKAMIPEKVARFFKEDT